jgi:cytochrome c biogenesis protein CcdA
MAVWALLLIIFGAGVVGGTINALISDNGFALPTRTEGILRPGWLGNAFIGGVAAVVSWSLYGPLAGMPIVAATGGKSIATGDLTLAAIGGAILVGVAGARWLSNEVDKKLLRAAGLEAAKKNPSEGLVAAFSLGTPATALQAAQSATEPALVHQAIESQKG